MTLHTFNHNNITYVKIIPSKKLFNSTMIHEVVTRGDIFALNLETGEFTILPGYKKQAEEARKKLRELADEMRTEL